MNRLACEGRVQDEVENARSNRVPRRASRSRFGVVGRLYPLRLRLPQRTVSQTIKSTFLA